MHLDREKPVWSSDKSSPRHPANFFQEEQLLTSFADMLNDGIRPADIKTRVGKGKGAAIVSHTFHRRVLSFEIDRRFGAQRRQHLLVGIVLLNEIISL